MWISNEELLSLRRSYNLMLLFFKVSLLPIPIKFASSPEACMVFSKPACHSLLSFSLPCCPEMLSQGRRVVTSIVCELEWFPYSLIYSEFIQHAGVLGTLHDVHVSRWFFLVSNINLHLIVTCLVSERQTCT